MSLRHRYADGALPAPGVYGVPEQWPHVREIYERAGFRVDADGVAADADSRTEVVFLAAVEDLPKPAVPPVAGLTVQRTVGINGTRIAGRLGDTVIGYIEVDTNLDTGARMSRLGDWADVGNLWVEPAHRRRGVGTWLVAQAGAWLRLGGVSRLLDYADGGEDGYAAFLATVGFHRADPDDARTHDALDGLVQDSFVILRRGVELASWSFDVAGGGVA